MADTPLTLAAIQAMDDDALHLAIAEQVEHWRAIRSAEVRAATGGTHVTLEGAFACVPTYTACWRATMALRHAHGQYIDLVWWGNSQRVRTMYGRMPFLDCTTEDEVRRAICQLVLWQTLAQRAWDAEEAAAQERAAAEENRLSNGEAWHE